MNLHKYKKFLDFPRNISESYIPRIPRYSKESEAPQSAAEAQRFKSPPPRAAVAAVAGGRSFSAARANDGTRPADSRGRAQAHKTRRRAEADGAGRRFWPQRSDPRRAERVRLGSPTGTRRLGFGRACWPAEGAAPPGSGGGSVGERGPARRGPGSRTRTARRARGFARGAGPRSEPQRRRCRGPAESKGAGTSESVARRTIKAAS